MSDTEATAAFSFLRDGVLEAGESFWQERMAKGQDACLLQAVLEADRLCKRAEALWACEKELYQGLRPLLECWSGLLQRAAASLRFPQSVFVSTKDRQAAYRVALELVGSQESVTSKLGALLGDCVCLFERAGKQEADLQVAAGSLSAAEAVLRGMADGERDQLLARLTLAKNALIAAQKRTACLQRSLSLFTQRVQDLAVRDLPSAELRVTQLADFAHDGVGCDIGGLSVLLATLRGTAQSAVCSFEADIGRSEYP